MKLFEQMTSHGHERVCCFHDTETGLRAIVAVHSTVLGNALGGTRRWHYADETDAMQDVLRLSEGMTYKSACAGLPMGGAKSVILRPDKTTAATEAEARAMGRFVDTLDGVYIAAEDVGVNEQFIDWMGCETSHCMGGTAEGHGGDPSPHTARGTFRGMQAALHHVGIDKFAGLTVAIQGVGSVGRNLARLLHEHGADLLVADINDQAVQYLVESCNAQAVGIDEILTSPCDVLAPCAMGGVLGAQNIPHLQTQIVCGAANNQLVQPTEDGARLRDRDILYAPDFIVNAGGVIHLAGLHLGMEENELSAKIDEIESTTAHILGVAAECGRTPEQVAVELAQHRIATESTEERLHAH